MYSFSDQNGEIYLNPGGRVFAYEVQFSNSFIAQGFGSEIMNVLQEWENNVGASKLTYSYINNVLLTPPDENSPPAQGAIGNIVEKFGGVITDYSNYEVVTHWHSSLDDLVTTLSNYLTDISNGWSAGFPTEVEVY